MKIYKKKFKEISVQIGDISFIKNFNEFTKFYKNEAELIKNYLKKLNRNIKVDDHILNDFFYRYKNKLQNLSSYHGDDKIKNFIKEYFSIFLR